MLAFILAGIVFVIGVVGWFIGWAVYTSYDAPSVQGDRSSPGCWLMACLMLSAVIAASHWLPHIGW